MRRLYCSVGFKRLTIWQSWNCATGCPNIRHCLYKHVTLQGNTQRRYHVNELCVFVCGGFTLRRKSLESTWGSVWRCWTWRWQWYVLDIVISQLVYFPDNIAVFMQVRHEGDTLVDLFFPLQHISKMQLATLVNHNNALTTCVVKG